MRPLTAADVMNAIDAVATHLPELQILVGDCHGHAWLADPTSATIYINGARPVDLSGSDVLDALDALCAYRDIPRAHRRLTLVPTPRAHLDVSLIGTGTTGI